MQNLHVTRVHFRELLTDWLTISVRMLRAGLANPENAKIQKPEGVEKPQIRSRILPPSAAFDRPVPWTGRVWSVGHSLRTGEPRLENRRPLAGLEGGSVPHVHAMPLPALPWRGFRKEPLPSPPQGFEIVRQSSTCHQPFDSPTEPLQMPLLRHPVENGRR